MKQTKSYMHEEDTISNFKTNSLVCQELDQHSGGGEVGGGGATSATLHQGKSEIFDSCDRPSNLAQTESKSMKSSIFGPCDLEIWQMTSKNNREPLSCF